MLQRSSPRPAARLAVFAAAALALALLALMIAPPGRVRANGVPIRIPLTYLSGLSNWGPSDAKGDAELSFAEGAVRLDLRGLPVLNTEQYQLWLVKSASNKAFSLGMFNADPSGTTGYTGKITGIDGYDYDLLQITVEPLPDTDPAPSLKRSIGGFFTPLKKPDSAGGEVAGDTQPATLPNTGDPLAGRKPATPKANHHTLGLMLIAGGAVLLVVVIRRRRPNT